jgi:hypothetical protein
MKGTAITPGRRGVSAIAPDAIKSAIVRRIQLLGMPCSGPDWRSSPSLGGAGAAPWVTAANTQKAPQCLSDRPSVSATTSEDRCGNAAAIRAARQSAQAAAIAKSSCRVLSPAQITSVCKARGPVPAVLPAPPLFPPPQGPTSAASTSPGQCIALRVVSQSTQPITFPLFCDPPPIIRGTVTVAATCGVVLPAPLAAGFPRCRISAKTAARGGLSSSALDG